MANISITAACNRHCAYCFARVEGVSDGASPHMPPTTYSRALDLLGDAEAPEVRLLGGEPTLHPQFPRFLDEALGRFPRVIVFSNGAIPEQALSCLLAAPQDRAVVLINATSGRSDRADLDAEQLQTLERLGARACIGLNLLRAPLTGLDLPALYDRFGLGRELRLGMAHPALGAENCYAHPKHYPDLAAQVVEIGRWAQEDGVSISLDCGFVPCMFPPEAREIPALASALEDCGRCCGAIPDILADGRVVHCYPLSALASIPLEGVDSLPQARAALQERLAPYSRLGVYKHCADCELMADGRCGGGCRAAALLRLRPALSTPRPRVPAVRRDDPAVEHGPGECWAIPYIDEDLRFWEGLLAEFGDRIAEVYLPLPGSAAGSGRPAQPAERVDRFLAAGLAPVSVLVNPVVLREPVEALAPDVVRRLEDLAKRARLSSVTVANLHLARAIREALPGLRLVASTLMDICDPLQVEMLGDLFDAVVPSSRIMRSLGRLRELRAAFPGELRLIVNEGCLPGCPLRVQHFYEMAGPSLAPPSLCSGILADKPWLRLTGAWVLPQHLHLYAGLYDQLKLAGRVTLRDPAVYRRVMAAYLRREPLGPDRIGGGPAGVHLPMPITEEFFRRTLECSRNCAECGVCEAYWRRHAGADPSR